jgi:hypothetical protein
MISSSVDAVNIKKYIYGSFVDAVMFLLHMLNIFGMPVKKKKKKMMMMSRKIME